MYLTWNRTKHILMDRLHPELEEISFVFIYFGWTDPFYTEPEETACQFVASSHKWTQRPPTLNETQMKTPLWFWPHLLEADIFLHSDPMGSWGGPDNLISIHVKLGSFLLFKTKFCQFGLGAEQRSSGAQLVRRESVEQVPPWPSLWAWLRDSCVAPKPQSTPQRRHHLLPGWLGHIPTPSSTKCCTT